MFRSQVTPSSFALTLHFQSPIYIIIILSSLALGGGGKGGTLHTDLGEDFWPAAKRTGNHISRGLIPLALGFFLSFLE